MEAEKETTPLRKNSGDGTGWPFAIGAILLPYVAMLYLYIRNCQHIQFLPVLVIAVVISAAAGAVFGISFLMFRNGWLSFCLSVLFLAGLFLYRGFCAAMPPIPHCVTPAYVLLLGLIALFFYYVFHRKKYRIHKNTSGGTYISIHLPVISKKTLAAIVLLSTLVLLAFNVARTLPLLRESSKSFLGTVWVPEVDRALPSPNVYWFHCDGMLGFDTFRKYYGDDQAGFRKFLEERGFKINRSAHFEGCHKTLCAVPALMCPNLYDTFLHGRLSTHAAAMVFFDKIYHEYKLPLAWHRMCHNELWLSFEEKGYHLVMVPEKPNLYLYNFRAEQGNIEYFFGKNQINNFIFSVFGKLGNLVPYLSPELFSSRFHAPNGTAWKAAAESYPKDIPGSDFAKSGCYIGYQNSEYLREAAAAVFQPAPRLVVYNLQAAHCPFIYDENGNCTPAAQGSDDLYPAEPRDYPPQHTFTVKILRENIRMVLERDPDAVIILQADHGLHCTTPEQFRKAFGKDCDYVELWNSTICAFRIPEKYRNGEEGVMMKTPLNISRYLINRFVGAGNCRYLE